MHPITPAAVARSIAEEARRSQRNAAIVEVLSYLGLRPDEAVRLVLSDVDPGIALTVRRAKKSPVQEDRLPLPYALFRHTCDLVRAKIIHADDVDRHYLFHSANPNKPLTTRTIANVIKGAYTRIGMEHVNPLALRHYAASRVEQVNGIKAAQVLLGHSTALTTQLYLDSSFSALSAALTLAHTVQTLPTQTEDEAANEVVQGPIQHPAHGLVPTT